MNELELREIESRLKINNMGACPGAEAIHLRNVSFQQGIFEGNNLAESKKYKEMAQRSEDRLKKILTEDIPALIKYIRELEKKKSFIEKISETDNERLEEEFLKFFSDRAHVSQTVEHPVASVDEQPEIDEFTTFSGNDEFVPLPPAPESGAPGGVESTPGRIDTSRAVKDYLGDPADPAKPSLGMKIEKDFENGDVLVSIDIPDGKGERTRYLRWGEKDWGYGGKDSGGWEKLEDYENGRLEAEFQHLVWPSGEFKEPGAPIEENVEPDPDLHDPTDKMN